MEVTTIESAIGKHSGELNAVKSNDAYKALLSEIEKEKTKKYSVEDEILAIMEYLEKESLVVKAKEKEAKEKEGEVAAIIARLTAEQKAGLESVAALEAERAEFAKHINENIMSKYDYIRSNRGGSALVEIVGGNCGGCHFELRQATINEASKGAEFVFCDSCSRILYKKPE
jgi:predicted  nucleic acid-binding Zn-ribbon protein